MAVIKHPAQRVGVFIDTQNLYHSAKHLYKSRVNFANVLAEAVGDRVLVRAIAYVISTDTGEENNFFDALTKIGIETDGAKKADWDVGIAIDAVKLAPKLDTVIIASGDGDFVPLIEFLDMHGVQVEVISFGKSSSQKLKEAAHAFTDMCENPKKFLIGARG
jgi:uncharacterized LabA/DUF88 family protein